MKRKHRKRLLKCLERGFAGGDYHCFMSAVQFCGSENITPPTWVITEIARVVLEARAEIAAAGHSSVVAFKRPDVPHET